VLSLAPRAIRWGYGGGLPRHPGRPAGEPDGKEANHLNRLSADRRGKNTLIRSGHTRDDRRMFSIEAGYSQ
jgi:hypothetical protein